MPFIIGTAGHIDHGKTSLVKALTGLDTDRLKEEKERGISIELGFAHLDLPDGSQAGVIDVPGHERFIRAMVAGSHGVDLVLFTVAADDGVMPQTVEHLDILHLLGVRRAIFVVTKTDLATEARVAEVASHIRNLAAGTCLDGSPVTTYSYMTGTGLDRLRQEIAHVLRNTERRPPGGYFRLPVDRAFAMRGHGLVVTGTALQGTVRVGDRVRCLPGRQVHRVRSVQVHGCAVESATWGQRVALNLAGPERPSIERGQTLCDERLATTTERFDARVEVRPGSSGLTNHQRIRMHLGTAERLGKIVVLGAADHIAPGQSAFCQVRIREPLQVLRGDRFILRQETAQGTLGGGVVIHPWPDAHRRSEPELEAVLCLLEATDCGRGVEAFLDARTEFATARAPICEFLNLTADETLERLGAASDIRSLQVDGNELFTTARKWNTLGDALITALGEFHVAHPLEQGRDMEELREKLPTAVPPKVYRAFVEALVARHTIAREGSLLRLPQHKVALRPGEIQMAASIARALAATPLAPPDIAQIAHQTGIDRAMVVQVLKVLESEGTLIRAAPDLYFLRESIDTVVQTMRQEFSDREDITPALFRDRFKTSRKYAIPLLEYLDAHGVTMRRGDGRRLRAVRSLHQTP